MPIFSRRRQRQMLDELSSRFTVGKQNELLGRLEGVATDPALAAEAELSALWAISQVAELECEPTLPHSSRRPDAFSSDLFPSAAAIIEVRALSDDSFSGKEAMERTANIICNYADQLKKGAGKHLYFEFGERSYWERQQRRIRLVDPNFLLSKDTKKILRTWILQDSPPHPEHIVICDGLTQVAVVWKDVVYKSNRVFCKMPPIPYDLEDNPVYRALRKKSRQIKGAASGALRVVFLMDAGCYMLRSLRPLSAAYQLCGEEVIRHAIRKLSVDIVCVFSPYREGYFGLGENTWLRWKVTVFDSRPMVPPAEYGRLEELAQRLPEPNFEGYQARSIHRDGGFSPGGRGWYLGTTEVRRMGEIKITMSARLVQERLAGIIDAESFQRLAFGDHRNPFRQALTEGFTFSKAELEPRGADKDDDHIVFTMEYDSAAGPLYSSTLKGKQRS